jgi:hypothetical protein
MKPSLRVVNAVARADGTDPASLEPPLNEVIDPEALDALFGSGTTAVTAQRGRVSFQYCGYDITVDSTGTVDIE